MMASPLLRFQTEEISIWIIQRNTEIRKEIGFNSENGEQLQVK
jgi:hypothetical protein